MDDIPLEEVRRFEGEMIAALRARPSAALKAIKETGKLEDDTASKLKEEITSFKKNHWKSAVVAPAKEGGAGERTSRIEPEVPHREAAALNRLPRSARYQDPAGEVSA